MAVEPVIHVSSRHVIVVVPKVREIDTKHILLFAIKRVKLLQLRIAVAHHRLGPVIGGRHPLRARGKQRCQFDVTRAHTQQAAAFAGAAALHRGAHHAVRKRGNWPVVQCAQQNGLRAAATAAGDGHAFGIHIRQARQKIQCPNAVPSLQAHDGLQPQLRLSTIQAPALFALHRRTLRAEAVGQFVRKLCAVRIANHVEEQHHVAQPSQRGGAGHLGHAAGFFMLLRADFDFVQDSRFTVLLQSPAVPMRAQHRWPFTFYFVRRSKQHAGHIKSRQTFEIHLLRGETLAMHLAVNHRVERRLGGHRVQAIGHRHAQLQLRFARLPRLQRLGHRKRKVAVQILEWL